MVTMAQRKRLEALEAIYSSDGGGDDAPLDPRFVRALMIAYGDADEAAAARAGGPLPMLTRGDLNAAIEAVYHE